MLSQKNFLTSEADSVLMVKNYGFFTKDSELIPKYTRRAKRWPSILKIPESEISDAEKRLDALVLKESTLDRILMADAVRTFNTKEYQDSLIKVTSTYYADFNDYQQNVTFIASFLLLFLTHGECLLILRKIREKAFLPGHFNAVSTGAKTDTLLFMDFLEAHFEPGTVWKKLESQKVPPDFLKKWFSGLLVHVLPFKVLFEYFEKFFEEGFPFCVKMGFRLFEALAEKITASPSIERTMALVELQPKCFGPEADFLAFCDLLIEQKTGDHDEKPMDGIVSNVLFAEGFDLQFERGRVYRDLVRPLLERADKYAEENPTEDIPICEICNDGFQELFCAECSLIICEDCHLAAPLKPNDAEELLHLKTHEVNEYEEQSYESDRSFDDESNMEKELAAVKID